MCVGVESPSKDVHASPASIQSSLGVLSGLFIDSARETHRTATWEAPPTPTGAAVNQDSSNDASPPVSLKTRVTENTWSKCSCEIFVWRPLCGGARIQCKLCPQERYQSLSSNPLNPIDDL